MTDVANPDQPADIEQSESELIAIRKEKLGALREKGVAFPNDFERGILAGCLHGQYGDKDKPELEAIENKEHYKVAGRIMLKRIMGKASFITISDMSGRIQCYLRKADLPEGVYNEFKHWDIGDIIGIEGTIFKTNTGELSLHAVDARMLTKSIRPLPDKYHGLSDTELRYRQRYVDLIMNDDTRKLFQVRSQIVSVIREFLVEHSYMEVETPMMQVKPGGAAAKPFKTYHNSLDLDMYLRIAPELFLKRLVVGGFERVFEINRNFRNEGLSTRHNPEFTMCEFYCAYADYQYMMDLTEAMLRKICETVNGTQQLKYQGESFDLSKPFTRMTVLESIVHFDSTINMDDLHDEAKARDIAKKLDIKLEDSYGLGKVQIEIFEKIVEPKLMEPTFITAYPAEVSPLARRNDDNDFITDRFEFFMGGKEIANGFSELNDAEDQAARFHDQVKAKDAGDEEAMHYDEDYITALEYGMPPTAGEGIGIDRLVMMFTDSASIRDVILFPHMKPVTNAPS